MAHWQKILVCVTDVVYNIMSSPARVFMEPVGQCDYNVIKLNKTARRLYLNVVAINEGIVSLVLAESFDLALLLKSVNGR